jgi:hypothetical protein
MRRRRYIAGALVVLGIAIAAAVVSGSGDGAGPWIRDDPLVDPVRVTIVQAGRITLEDGRSFTLAGIACKQEVPPELFDEALRVAVAQGVRVDRDLGNGAALLTVEPRFYDWCGTCRRRSAGLYRQAPLSHLLIAAGYADADDAAIGLTDREMRTLRAVRATVADVEPARISDTAFRRGCEESLYVLELSEEDLRELLEAPADEGVDG